MPILSKPEWEPIFREGLNLVTIEEFFDIGVSKFPYSKTRNQIFDGFLKYVEIVKSTNLAGEIWLNGSFLTLKEDPEDIDLVFRFSGIQVDKLSDTDKENLEDCLLKSYQLELKCDNYVLAEYPDNHPGYAAE